MNDKKPQAFINNTAKHIQIANIVREQILNGDFAPGTRLCSDAELAAQYNIHRHTVAEGLKLLVEEGLLERAPRRGSVITGMHKEPIYLLIPCPDFLEENNNSAIFIRRLYKNLHLQLMNKGISVITVPMSPTNNQDDIAEKYFAIIPHGAKVICIGEWGLSGLSCLKAKQCNVVFYDFQNIKRAELVARSWKKLIFDRATGAYNAVAELAQAYNSPLLMFINNQRYMGLALHIQSALEAKAEYFPELPEQNILWCENRQFEDFAANFNALTHNVNFDSVYFPDVELARVVLNAAPKLSAKGIISNDITEIISAPNLCHYAINPANLAKMTIELFMQPNGTEKIIKPESYNVGREK